MKLNLPQYAFNAGAVGSKIVGRADLSDLYRKAAKDISNMIPTQQGLLLRRPGTHYLTKSIEDNVRLVPYVYDSNNSYMLEFADDKIRVFKGRDPVMIDAGTVANGSFASDTSSWTDLLGAAAWADGQAQLALAGGEDSGTVITQQQTGLLEEETIYAVRFDISSYYTIPIYVSIGRAAGGTDILDRYIVFPGTDQIVYFTANTSDFFITFSATEAGVDENSNVLDDPNIYIDNVQLLKNLVIRNTGIGVESLQTMSYDVSGQRVYIASSDFKPKVLYRTSDYDWFLFDLPTYDGPYFDIGDTVYGGRGSRINLTLSATTGDTVVTASDILFQEADRGRHLRFRSIDTADWGYGTISQVISPTQVIVQTFRNFDATTASQEWMLGAWGDSVGYPSVVAASQGRICWANTPTQPNGFWASKSSSPYNYSPDDNFDDNITASSAVSILIAEATDVRSLGNGNNKLFVGSSSGIFSISDLSQGFYSVAVQRVDSAGTSNLMPVKSQGSVFFISRGLRNFYNVSYAYDQIEEGYRAEDMSVMNDDYAVGGFLEATVVQVPFPMVWIRNVNGELLSLTYNKKEKIQAWASHSIGGSGSVIAIATQPRLGSDDVWMAVQRNIGGEVVTTLEYMTDIQTALNTKYDLSYLDGSSTWSSQQPVAYLSGLNHLIGTTPTTLVSGGNYSSQNISSSGVYTLPIESGEVTVGHQYTSSVTLLQQEGGSNRGSVFGKPYRINEARVRFWATNGATLRFEQEALQNQESVVYFNEDFIFGEGFDLFTGWKVTKINSGSKPEVNIILTSQGALAMNIQCVMLEAEGSEF